MGRTHGVLVVVAIIGEKTHATVEVWLWHKVAQVVAGHAQHRSVPHVGLIKQGQQRGMRPLHGEGVGQRMHAGAVAAIHVSRAVLAV